MTDAENARIEANRQRELAAMDMQDIKTLRGAECFNRYFMRRLRDKRAAIDTRFHNDPPAKCDAVGREALRQVIQEYNSLLTMLDDDERSAAGTLSTLPRDHPASSAPVS